MRAIGYVRASVANGDSVDAQSEAIRTWAVDRGHDVIAVHADDGRSGVLDVGDRPGLAAALDALPAHALVVHRLDRLARALHVQEAVLAKAWEAGVRVIEVVGDREVLRDDPDDPMRTFVRQVVGAAAQLERGLVRARMQGGRRRKAARGGYVGGLTVPFGMRLRNGSFERCPEEASVVERIVALRAGGSTWRQVAAALEADRVPSPRGGRWHAATV